jgi:glycosyltransferase involved in cell wall biosynthesis
MTVIARPEPENSLLEIVQGFSAKPRGMQLVVLGNYSDGNVYHCAVKAAASAEVCFVGAIYDKTVVQALRFHSAAYVHGHQVGGTNPSLVEALGAGNAVIAHDNRFNRWVVGEGAVYFDGAEGFAKCMDQMAANPDILQSLRDKSVARFTEAFTWPDVLAQYESMLKQYLPVSVLNARPNHLSKAD